MLTSYFLNMMVVEVNLGRRTVVMDETAALMRDPQSWPYPSAN